MSEVRKTYAAGEVTIVWQPSLCIHSEKCYHGLPAVFDPTRRPWIQTNAANTEAIIAQVRSCPSGALSIESADKTAGSTPGAVRAEILRDGPLLVQGSITVVHADVARLVDLGLIERADDDRATVPFDAVEIRMALARAA